MATTDFTFTTRGETYTLKVTDAKASPATLEDASATVPAGGSLSRIAARVMAFTGSLDMNAPVQMSLEAHRPGLLPSEKVASGKTPFDFFASLTDHIHEQTGALEAAGRAEDPEAEAVSRMQRHRLYRLFSGFEDFTDSYPGCLSDLLIAGRRDTEGRIIADPDEVSNEATSWFLMEAFPSQGDGVQEFSGPTAFIDALSANNEKISRRAVAMVFGDNITVTETDPDFGDIASSLTDHLSDELSKEDETLAEEFRKDIDQYNDTDIDAVREHPLYHVYDICLQNEYSDDPECRDYDDEWEPS